METIREIFKKLNIPYSPSKEDQLIGYMEEVLELNQHINLTAITDKEEFINISSFDSNNNIAYSIKSKIVKIYEYIQHRLARCILDVMGEYKKKESTEESRKICHYALLTKSEPILVHCFLCLIYFVFTEYLYLDI